jgi:hypothetical protein
MQSSAFPKEKDKQRIPKKSGNVASDISSKTSAEVSEARGEWRGLLFVLLITLIYHNRASLTAGADQI